MENQKLIVEVFRQSDLKQLMDQAQVPTGMMMVEGVFGRVDSENRNKRYYPKDIYAKHIELMQKRIVESKGIFGELEHPTKMSVDLNNVSHKVTSVRLDEDGYIRGTVLLLDTPKGQIAQSIVRSGSPLPISSRAVGKVQKDGAVHLDFLSTYDLVGTSGFAEAQLNQQRVYESLDESGNVIQEMFEYDIDDKGNAIEASTLKNIVESVEARLMSTFMSSEKFEEILEAKLQEKIANGQIVLNENAGDESQVAINEEQLIALMNERFLNTYSPIIESWITKEFAPHIGTTIQEWLSNDYAKIVESWIVEDVLPENAKLTESWLTETLLPENARLTESWLTNEFSTKMGDSIQEWLTSEFTPHIVESVTESLQANSGLVVTEAVVEAPVVEAPEVVIEAVVEAPVAQTVMEQATIFKSNILTRIDAIVESANSIEQPLLAQVDETHYQFAPAWLKAIPNDYKAIWQSLNESQREQLFKRASVRILESDSEINRFWKSIDFAKVLNLVSPTVQNRQLIVENAEDAPKVNPRSSVVAYAKHLRQVS